MPAIRSRTVEETYNMDEIFKVDEKFYSKLYNSTTHPQTDISFSITHDPAKMNDEEH